MDTADAREWVRLDDLAEAAKTQQKEYRAQADALAEQIIEQMIADGDDKVTVNGRTVYPHTRVAAGKRTDVDSMTYYETLRAAGLGDMIAETIPAQTIAAWAREHIDNDLPIPEEVATVLAVHQITTLRQTAAGKSAGAKRRDKAG